MPSASQANYCWMDSTIFLKDYIFTALKNTRGKYDVFGGSKHPRPVKCKPLALAGLDLVACK